MSAATRCGSPASRCTVHAVEGGGRGNAIRKLRSGPKRERPAHAVADVPTLPAACRRVARRRGSSIAAVSASTLRSSSEAMARACGIRRASSPVPRRTRDPAVVEVGEHDEVADGGDAPRHVVQLLALAGRVHVEEHDRERPALVGVGDEGVHRAVGRPDVELAVDHACLLWALSKHEPQRDNQPGPISQSRKPEVPMRFAPTVIAALCALACATATAADTRTLPDAAQLKSM